MNDELANLQDRLVRLHKKLRDQLVAAPDAAARQALITEMTEVTHRVQVVGGLLFAAQSVELDASLEEVRKATKDVHAAIADVADLQKFLGSMNAFLGLVDDAIDLAKSLAT